MSREIPILVYNNIKTAEDKAMKPLKEKISITIDGDILEKLRVEAEYDDRSLSQYINIILKEHIRQNEKNK